MCPGTHPMIVASKVHSAFCTLVFTLVKVELVRIGHASTFTLFRATRVVKAYQFKGTRLLDSSPPKGSDEEAVESTKQLVETPLRPIDDLRIELLNDELKRISVFASYLFAG